VRVEGFREVAVLLVRADSKEKQGICPVFTNRRDIPYDIIKSKWGIMVPCAPLSFYICPRRHARKKNYQAEKSYASKAEKALDESRRA